MSDINKLNASKFEHLCVELHRSNYNHKTYHWDNIPENILYQSGFIHDFNRLRLQRLLDKSTNKINSIQEYGLDGISYEILDNKPVYHGLQMKLWDNTLSGRDLGTFFQVMYFRMFIKNNLSKSFLYHTSKLEKNLEDDIKNSNGLMTSVFMKNPYKVSANTNIDVQVNDLSEVNYVLKQYQKDAILKLNEGLEKVGLLDLVPGTGKTVICANHIKDKKYKTVIILSPLRIHAKQNLNRISPFISNHKQLLVDSDFAGTRKFEDVVNILKDQCIISATFKSADIISQLFDKEGKTKYDLKNSILVVDEAHNLVNNTDIIKLIKQFPNSLLMTGTSSSSLEEIMESTTIYSYGMPSAIKNKDVCDYQSWLPVITEKVVDIDKPKELKKLDTNLCKKSLFLINGMLKTGSRRCIVYLSTQDECKEFETILQTTMDKYHGLPWWTNTIIGKTRSKDRDTIIKDFQKEEDRKDTLKFLCSVRILDEAVNIVRCDSIFIAHIGDSINDIRIVQRICRANRIDPLNPNKIANCFLWCDDLNNAVNLLQTLKSNDIDFHNKISVMNGNYDKEHETETINLVKSQNIDLHKFIDVKCLSVDDIFEMKKKILFEYCNKNKKTVPHHTIYKDIQIWGWLEHKKYKIFAGDNKMYDNLCENKYVKEDIDNFLKNKEKKRLTFDKSKDLLFKYCNQYKTVPTRGTIFEEYNIGDWLHYQKCNIDNKDNDIYKKLSVNNYVKENLNVFLTTKEENKEKIKLTFDDWKKLLFKYCNESETHPPMGVTYKGENVGNWFQKRKNNIKDIDDPIYKKLMVNKYAKKSMDDNFTNKKIYEAKEKFTFDEWKTKLFNYCNENKTSAIKNNSSENIRMITWLSEQKKKIDNNSHEIYKKLSLNKHVKESLDSFLKTRLNKNKK